MTLGNFPSATSVWLRGTLFSLLIVHFLTIGIQAGEQKYEVRGKIVLPNGEIDPGVRPRVFLQAIKTIFYDQTLAGRGWDFRFRELEPGEYTLLVIAQGLGASKKTIVIGPSLADSKGLIEITVALAPATEATAEISATALAIPNQATKEYQKALESLRKQDRESAIRHLERAVERAPHFADAWNRLGTIFYKAQEYTDAERCFREAIAQDPTSYPPLVNLGAALLSQNRLEDALRVNRNAVERQPDDPLAQAQLGGTYFALGKLDQAEQHLRAAKLKDRAHFSNPQLMLAKIYIQRQDYAAAIGELKEFLSIHPDYPQSAEIEEVIRLAHRLLRSSAESDP